MSGEPDTAGVRWTGHAGCPVHRTNITRNSISSTLFGIICALIVICADIWTNGGNDLISDLETKIRGNDAVNNR